eukprot:5899884-Prymnesium_polylepis.1
MLGRVRGERDVRVCASVRAAAHIARWARGAAPPASWPRAVCRSRTALRSSADASPTCGERERERERCGG